jgi:hypothetical protein
MFCVRASFILLLLFATLSFGQSGTGVIFGTVADSSGAAVPGAKVRLTQTATGTTEETQSNADGNYIFTNLRPSTYRVSVEASGFKVTTRDNILIEVDQRARIDLGLQVGDIKESVSVEANVTTVDTFSATIKEVVDSNRMVDLPLNGRNALQLQALLPGSVQMGTGSAATGIALNTNNVFAINGTRPNQSSYTLDGALNMDMYNNLPAAFPNPDALQEFSILQNSYSAVNGRNAGAVVNMVTRSGTNQYRGTLWEFLRNDKLNTRNFFARGVDPLRRNQFGVTLGGPINIPKLYNGKDRTFFFFAYEGTRERIGRTRSDIVVPTALERQGDFSQSTIRGVPVTVAPPETVTAANPRGTPYPDARIPANRIDPVARAFTNAFFPLPNAPGNIFTYNLSVPTDDDQTTLKIDHSFTDNNKFSFRWFWDDFRRRANEALPSFNSANNWTTHNFTFNDTHIFSPTVVNTLTFLYAGNDFVRAPLPTDPVDWTALGCVSCETLAPPGNPTDWAISIANGFGVRVSTAFISRQKNFQIIDTMQWTKGNHLLSFGFDLAYLQRRGNEFFQVTPQWSFNGQLTGNQGYGYADFYHGAPISVYQNSPLRAFQYKWTPFLYFQDDWRVSRRLTINLGLRWEPYVTVRDKRGELNAFRAGQQSTIFPRAPLGMVFPGDPGITDGIVPNRYNKWGPRFGFAYDPFGDGKTSIRGGYGIFNDTVRLVNLNGWSTNQPFSFGQTTFNPFSLTDPYRNDRPTLELLRSYGTLNPSDRANRTFFLPLNLNTIDPDFDTGYVQQWNLNVQRQLPWQVVFTVGYVGTKGTHLLVNQNINPALFVPGQSTTGNVNARRIYPGYQAIQNAQSTANSTYHSLQLSWNRRFASGLSILGSYVWSKAIDQASNDGNSGAGNQAANPFCWSCDKGLADFDIRHRFVSSFLWELPIFNQGGGWKRALLGGWQLNGILTLQSGRPFTVNAGVDRSLAGIGRDRADYLGGEVQIFSDVPRGQMVDRYFDTSASIWQLPALGTFGTVGRNTLIGPGYANFDSALFKQFRITEGREFELRWEVFNTFNRPNFNNPVSAVNNVNFGRITSASDPRIMQVAAKFRF